MTRRFDVLGCHITAGTFDDAVARVLARVRAGGGGYVCFVNGHLAVTGREDPAVLAALNGSWMSLPDGRPVYATGRLQRVSPLEPVPGPDFMRAMLRHAGEPALRHYFLGGQPEVLARLVEGVHARCPSAVVVGSCSPPFRPLATAEREALVSKIRAARPDLVWVGLGAPKQELFMSGHWEALQPAVLLGVGAAFDFIAGSVSRAPAWMRRLGLEWLYRLCREPRRLWRRYAYTNTMFVAYLLRDLLARRDRPDC